MRPHLSLKDRELQNPVATEANISFTADVQLSVENHLI